MSRSRLDNLAAFLKLQEKETAEEMLGMLPMNFFFTASQAGELLEVCQREEEFDIDTVEACVVNLFHYVIDPEAMWEWRLRCALHS